MLCGIYQFVSFSLQLSKPVIDAEKTAKEHENLQAKCRELRVQCLDLEKKKQLCKWIRVSSSVATKKLFYIFFLFGASSMCLYIVNV